MHDRVMAVLSFVGAAVFLFVGVIALLSALRSGLKNAENNTGLFMICFAAALLLMVAGAFFAFR